MSQNLDHLKYTEEHEWISVDGDIATVGITDFAQESLGDIVFVELPETGRSLSQNETFGVVESIKSVSDLYSPITGEVVETNSDLEGSPEACNSAPYDSWMIKLKVADTAELESLMDASAYANHCQANS